ncbi:glycosyltransferase family 2 protein [Sagittula sp. SSi028]|uniref:glycosyltransferase family 2 protein n=1 Tax=Sagittula sp. SSi028 TaxID=3400636 RepID=UPI003AF9A08C
MGPTVSIVVVSRHRPADLMRCLTGLSQLDYAKFEIIVVACPQGLAAIADRPDRQAIKTVAFDVPNISAARNLGIAQAAGDLVAFIDDDAVPEPLWLRHLTAPFADPTIATAGGYVLGRNGLSYQWRARSVDATGHATPLEISGDALTVPTPPPGHAVKTEGTNMAVRRSALAELGGFDPAFRFYLDETDLNMRLAATGGRTAIVPRALVHHGVAASARRRQDRTPRDLRDIAASQQIFLQKHCPVAEQDRAWTAFRQAQRLRLIRAMQSGALDPTDVIRLMRGLDKGRREGRERTPHAMPLLPVSAPFLPYPARTNAPRRLIAGRIWNAARLRKQAAESAAQGNITTLILLGPSTRYHHVRFTDDGYWEQSGGLWGRSLRDQPLFRPWRFARRIDAETARVTYARGQFDVTLGK